MDHQKKLDFVLRMTKQGLDHVQHFQDGGTALTGPTTVGTQNAVKAGGIAGFLGDILGTTNKFQATGAQIQQGTNAAQLNQAYNQAQAGLGAAQNLTGAVTPGISQGAGSQALLTQQLINQAQGRGPNPAQAALNQATGQNIAQAAALAAGTRGAGANAGLIAQNAAMQGANLNQQAAAQSAVMQAQQQLAAQGQLQNLAAQQIGQGQSAIGLQNQLTQSEQAQLQAANQAANQQAVSMQENINDINAKVAAQNAESGIGLLKGIGSAVNAIGGGISTLASGKGFGALFPSPTGKAEGGYVPDFGPEHDHLRHMHSIYHGKGLGSQLKAGGQVPGTPKVQHNAYKNDTVSAKLTPGEVVIDLDTLHDKGELGQMARHVAQEIERKKRAKK